MQNPYLKYSTLAFQMGATIGIFTYAGYKLDEHFKCKAPFCTIVLSLTGIGLSLYTVIRDFIKPDK